MKKYHDIEYLEMLKKIIEHGSLKTNRTGISTKSIFGHQLRFDISNNSIPLLTTKKISTNSIIREIIWYLSGNTNIKYLKDNNVNIWNEWADENGDLGPVYGAQWRKWKTLDGNTIDQISNVIEAIKTNPNDRRIIVSAWNVGELDQMALPPCHLLFQFYCNEYTIDQRRDKLVEVYGDYYGDKDEFNVGNEVMTKMCDSLRIPKGELSCALTQRSADSFLGVPFNIAQYSILTHMIAFVTGYEAKEFIWTGNDVHIYSNHFDQVNEQLSRDPYKFHSPSIQFNRYLKNIDDFKFEDISIVDYNHQAFIKAPVAV